jgi:hypothetical protein
MRGSASVVARLITISEELSGNSNEDRMLQTVQAFYTACNADDSDRAPDFTSDGGNRIDPGGVQTRERESVLTELREERWNLFERLTDTSMELNACLQASHVRVAAVGSRMSSLTMSEGVWRAKETHIRT